MKKVNSYLYTEPYVHLEIGRNEVLLYNQLNGRMIKESDSNIFNVIKRLKNDTRVIITKLTELELQDNGLFTFIEKIKKFYMGDLIMSNQIPIQVSAALKIDFDYETLYGPNILSNLLELNIYLNNYKTNIYSKKFLNVFKQFPTNYSSNSDHYLSFIDLVNFIKECKKGHLRTINILGGNLFDYLYFDKLVCFLNTLNIRIVYNLYYKETMELRKLKMLSNKSQVNLIIDFPIDKDYLQNSYQILTSNSIHNVINYIIESERDVKQAEDLSSLYSFSNVKFSPYFNHSNLDFFQEHVFIDLSTILESKPTQNELFKNQTLNSFYFGKLTILNDGRVFSNVNNLNIGTINESVYEIVNSALKDKSSWKLVREDVTPCNECIYRSICPPISGYERIFGYFNLCNIKV